MNSYQPVAVPLVLSFICLSRQSESTEGSSGGHRPTLLLRRPSLSLKPPSGGPGRGLRSVRPLSRSTFPVLFLFNPYLFLKCVFPPFCSCRISLLSLPVSLMIRALTGIVPLTWFGSRWGARQDVCVVSRIPQLTLKCWPSWEPGTVGVGVGVGRSGFSSGSLPHLHGDAPHWSRDWGREAQSRGGAEVQSRDWGPGVQSRQGRCRLLSLTAGGRGTAPP